MASTDDDSAGAWGVLILVLLLLAAVVVVGRLVSGLTNVFRKHGRHLAVLSLLGLWLASLLLAVLIGAAGAVSAGVTLGLVSTGGWLAGLGLAHLMLERQPSHGTAAEELDTYLTEWPE